MSRKKRETTDDDWGFGSPTPPRNDDVDEPEPAALAPVPPEPAALAPPGLHERARDAVDFSRLAPEARTFVSASKSPETQRIYAYHWRAFERWAQARGLRPLPADPHDVANYCSFRATKGVPREEVVEDEEADARLRAERAKAIEEARAARKEGSEKEPPPIPYVPRRTYSASWSFSTLKQALAAIRLIHLYNGLLSPCDSLVVSEALTGIRNAAGAKPERKEALTPVHLEAASRALGEGLIGLRDRSLLLLGFSGMLRRGELAALEVQDLTFSQDKGRDVLRLDLSRHFSGQTVRPGTKANPGGTRSEVLGIHAGKSALTCPIHSTRAWLDAAKITEGRVYRSVREVGTSGPIVGEPITPQTVALAVKDAIARMGLDPTRFSGHSLRRGGATTAFRAGHSLPSVQRQTRHAKLDTLMIYLQDAGLYEDNASEGIL